MKRHFQKFRDPRFALTTLQNPDLEVRTYAELVQAAQQEREWQPTALRIAATQPLATPAAPDSIPVSELPADLELPEASPDEFPDNVASAAPPDSTNPGSPDPEPTDDNAQQILDSLLADVVTAGASLPSSSPAADDEPTPHPAPKPRRKSKSRRNLPSAAPNGPNPPPSNATPANVPSANILTARRSKNPSSTGAVLRRSCTASTSKLKPPSTTTPTLSIFSPCATATCSPPSQTSSKRLTRATSAAPKCSMPSAPSPTSPKTAAGSIPPANPNSCTPCSACLPGGPAHWTRAAPLPAGAASPHKRAPCRPSRPARRRLPAG